MHQLLLILGVVLFLGGAFLVAFYFLMNPEGPDKKDAYQLYLSSPDWQFIRSQRLEYDQYTCCGCLTGRHLQVHHVTYDNLGHEQLEDLVTVCERCHRAIHVFARKHKCGLAYATHKVLCDRRRAAHRTAGAWEAQ